MGEISIKISTLPTEIIRKIPYSIRTYKDEYYLRELPFDIQHILEEYLSRDSVEDKDRILDIVPKVSQYGDFLPIRHLSDLVIEYVKNYFVTQPGQYPFDPNFGSRLKQYIQKLDRSVMNHLISDEVRSIINSVSKDLNVNIEVKSFDVAKSSSTGVDVEYNFYITLDINDTIKTVNVTFT